MEKHDIPWELISSKWFICLFCDILPIETVLRIWDCLLYNGSTIIMKTALLTLQVSVVTVVEFHIEAGEIQQVFAHQ